MDPTLNEPISIDTTKPMVLDEPISIDTGAASIVPPTSQVASQRAYKATAGLGNITGKSQQDAYLEIANGQEGNYRQDAAARLDMQNAQNKQKLIRDLTNRKGAPLSDDELNMVFDPSQPFNQKVDPDSVIEQAYGNSVVSTLQDAGASMGSTFLQDAQADTPKSLDSAMRAGSTFTAKREYAGKVAEDLQNTIGNQGTIPWLADQAKYFASLGLYDEVKLRGLVGGIIGGGLATNLQEQTTQLFSLPFPQYKATLDSIVAKLQKDNPTLALQFVGHIFGQSTSDRILGDVQTGLNIAMFPGIATLGKTAMKTIGLIDASRTAVNQVVEAAAVPGATRSDLLNAAGATQDAAATKVIANAVEDAKGVGDPQQRAADALVSGLNTDQAKVAANPGRFGQEIINRLDQQTELLKQGLTETFPAIPKVSRIPEVTSDSSKMLEYIKSMKDNYTGPENTLRDITGPHYDPYSNGYWFKHIIGNEDGSLFKTPEQARGKADMQGLVIETPPEYIKSIDDRIAALQTEIKDNAPSMDADVHELNRHYAFQDQLNDLLKEKANIDRRGPEGFSIEANQQGLGWYISKMVPLQETDNIIRDGLAKTTESQLVANWKNAWLGWARTPEETLSKLENEQRKITTHGPSRLLEVFKGASKDIEKLPGKYWDDWSRAIDATRKDIDPRTERPGYFQPTPGDLEDFYQRNFKRLPELPEIQAYFAFRNNIEAERGLRTIRALSLKARLGVEQHSIYSLDSQGNRTYSPFFEGVRSKTMPGGEATVLVQNAKGETTLVATNNPKYIKIRDKLKKDVEQGKYTVTEVHNPELRPLQGYGPVTTERVQYVITNNYETKPLSYSNQVNRVGGGHFVVDSDYYAKQAKINFDPVTQKHWGEGDTTVAAIPNFPVGKEFIKHTNEVRKLLNSGDEAGAKAYHTNNKLPMDWEEHLGWYKESRKPGGEVVPPHLSLNEPIYLVSKNRLIVDIYKSELEARYPKTFKDGTREGSLARQSMVEFTGERDAYELNQITDKGTKGNPLYAYEAAKFVDPIPTYNRALNRIVNSTFMDDIKINSTEHWIEQAKPYLKASEEDLRHAPFYYMAQPEWNKLDGAGNLMKLNLESARYKINQFVGTPSKVDTFLHATAEKLSEAVYNKFGPKAALIPASALPYVKDPLAFTRSVVFHMKMGLFAVPQFLTQLSTAANVFAISGARNVPSVLTAVALHQWSRLNSSPAILAHLDELATKMRIPGTAAWRPGEWLEARKLLIDTGFKNIGGEHAMLDTPWAAKVVRNGKDSFLDWGEAFFREGAANTRMAAFFAAYKEFRDGIGGGVTYFGSRVERRTGNATDALSREDIAAILARAADLDHNQSRASNSALHTGIMSVPAQFLAYSLRLSELMTGKRLTWQEKTSLMATSAVLYGFPVGALGLYGYPIADYIKRKAQDAGYVVGDNYITSMFMEGAPAAMVAAITGGGDPQKGSWYNFSKYGSKGLDPLEQSLDSSKTMWDVFGGATVSTLSNLWAQSSGYRNLGMNLIRGDQAQFALTSDDMLAPLREVAEVNNLWRIKTAINTGKWLSKNETYLSDTSPLNAFMMGMTGLSEIKVADVTVTAKAIQVQEEMNKYILAKFIKEMHRGFDAVSNGDNEQAEAYFKNAKAWFVVGDYPMEKRGAAIATASAYSQDLPTRLNWDYFMKDLPPSKAATRMDTMSTLQQIQNKKKEP